VYTTQSFDADGSVKPGIMRVSPFAAPAPDRRANAQSEENACVANIGPQQRRQRMAFGVISLALGVVLAALLVALHTNPLWRLSLFLPFVSGAEGIFQALEKT
jgi:hypothetical protein